MLYLLWHCVAAHMGAVLWSMVLHAVLHSTQPLQPLHSPAPDWSHTSQHNNNNQTHQLIPSPLGAWLCTRAYPRYNRQVLLGGLAPCQGIPSACVSHTRYKWMLYNTGPEYIQGAQHININSNISIRVTHDCPNIASTALQLHQLVPLHESIHHAQDHSLTILQGTTKNCLCFCAVAGPPLRSVLHLLLGLAQVD